MRLLIFAMSRAREMERHRREKLADARGGRVVAARRAIAAHVARRPCHAGAPSAARISAAARGSPLITLSVASAPARTLTSSWPRSFAR